MSDESDLHHPWDAMLVEFDVEHARVVATLGHDGGALVENVRRLRCSEGRLYSFETSDERELHTLEYFFGFSACEEAEPYPSNSVPGRIVITGTHPNGRRLEIRGNGWVGYDEAGNVEGRFETPPVMITEDSDPEDDVEAVAGDRERRGAHDFPMPPQFVQATVRFPRASDPWDD